MKRNILITLILTLCTLNSYADYGKAYYFKGTIHTQDTMVTGYFHLPYEFLPDSILNKFKSDNKYFEKKIKSHSHPEGIELYSFLFKYGFRTAENDTSYVLCKSREKIRIRTDEIKDVKYHDVIIYNSWGNWVDSEILEEDLVWLNTSPIKVIFDTSDDCLHQYFILHQKNNTEIDKIINELMSLSDTNSLRQQELEFKLKAFKIISIKRHRC
jgi:hypothetical protein